jgi:hypothetical protein
MILDRLYEGDDPGPCIIDFTSNGYAVARTASEKSDPKSVPPNALYRDLRTNLPNQVYLCFPLLIPPACDGRNMLM